RPLKSVMTSLVGLKTPTASLTKRTRSLATPLDCDVSDSFCADGCGFGSAAWAGSEAAKKAFTVARMHNPQLTCPGIRMPKGCLTVFSVSGDRGFGKSIFGPAAGVRKPVYGKQAGEMTTRFDSLEK